MTFKHYAKEDYAAVCDFLIELNRADTCHIHWNWARFEWMAEHPEFDQSALSSIGLWTDGDRVVGAAIYDMYFGEGFCAALPSHAQIFPDILDYAFRELRDGGGFGFAICDDRLDEIAAAEQAGFSAVEQDETMLCMPLRCPLKVSLPDGYRFASLDPVRDAYALQWLFWQGFDHGSDREEFERTEEIIPRVRPHFNPDLCLAALDPSGEPAACCCVWYLGDTDYAYLEPVCTVPAHRGCGLAKALIYEALNRAHRLGAQRAFVLSDMDFYRKLGFEPHRHFTFYWKQ